MRAGLGQRALHARGRIGVSRCPFRNLRVAALQLRIERGGGNALVAINRDSITQIQLLHW